MNAKKSTKKTCSRGHVFTKSSDCPVCPKCWAGYYATNHRSDLPKIGAPALRALLNAGIMNLKRLSAFSEADILGLHGMGPSSLPALRKALKEKGLGFKED